MPFQAIEILSTGSDKILTKVSHQDHFVTALIVNKKSEEIVTGQPFQAEIGYDQILDWKVITDFDYAKSGIWQEEDGVHLRGKVHSLVDFGDGVTMIDVYIQNGPEFFTVNLEAMNNETSESHAGLEIIVGKLYLYPNDQ